MVPVHELLVFMLAAFLMVITPGPNMLYLISRTLTQGKKAGLLSLCGIVSGFFIHILFVTFGLTALLLTIPLVFTLVKMGGVLYLLFLAYQTLQSKQPSIFERPTLRIDPPRQLVLMGFLTSVLNPKVALFYFAFFPQFMQQQYGSFMLQSLQLGVTQMLVSGTINFFIVLGAAKVATYLSKQPKWVQVQKWFMAGLLSALAFKMATTTSK